MTVFIFYTLREKKAEKKIYRLVLNMVLQAFLPQRHIFIFNFENETINLNMLNVLHNDFN